MDFDQIKRRAWFSASLIALLGVLGLVMALLQYRWTGELSRAEQDRLGDALQRSLSRLSHDLDEEILSPARALPPTDTEVAEQGREAAYIARLRRWATQTGDTKLLRAVGLAIPDHGALQLKILDPGKREFAVADWPASWSILREQLTRRARGERVAPTEPQSLIVEIPRFSRTVTASSISEHDWLILEFDPVYIREVLLPRQVARHLPSGDQEPYQVEVFEHEKSIFRLGLAGNESIRQHASASIRLLVLARPGMMARPMGGPPPHEHGPRANGDGRPRPPLTGGMGLGPRGGSGRWQMFVSPPGGSLDTLVERARWRNFALALTLIALIIATALLLVRSARQAQQLAELQMNFVSSVSHELRTPLTVIRTAAFNLRGRVAAKPDQVERYGKLIQEQSEKLGALVEQVLRYASSRVGQVIHEREAVVIDDIIEGGIRSSQLALDSSPYQLDKQVDPGLPLVLADERALQHVVQNLLDNAVKYGTETSNWIGLSAHQAGEFVEIKVADRGPGIPPDERALVFEPFFRGRRALADQINGTGLGLNLVKKIVEAHGGTIRVQCHVPQGSEFIVRVPIAPPEMQDEFAHTAG